MASNWKKLLKDASSRWSKAVEESKALGSGSEVPDGRYYAVLNNAEIVTSESSGRLQVAWEAVIDSGDYKGSIVRDYDGLETDQNLKYLARRLAVLDCDVDDMDLSEELEDVLAELSEDKPRIKIRLRTKQGSDYQNMYVDEVVESTTAGQKPAPKKSAAPPAKTPTKKAPEPEPEEEEEEPEVKKPATKPTGKKPPVTPPPPAKKTAKKAPEPEPEPEEEAEEEEGEEGEELVEVKVGMRCEFVKGNRTVEGEIVKLLNDDTIAQVKTNDGKIVRVPIDEDFVVLEEEPED